MKRHKSKQAILFIYWVVLSGQTTVRAGMKSTQDKDCSDSVKNVTSGRVIGSAITIASTERPTERDPLLSSTSISYSGTDNESRHQGIIRERRSSKSTSTHRSNEHFQSHEKSEKGFGGRPAMRSARSQTRGNRSDSVLPQLPDSPDRGALDTPDSSYDIYNDNDIASRSGRSNRSVRSQRSHQSRRSRTSSDGRYGADNLHQYYNERANRIFSEGSSSEPPLLEVPEEIFAVRRAALTVFDPLTYSWVSVIL